MQIKVDYNNMMADFIGKEQGFTDKELSEGKKIAELLKRPNINYDVIREFDDETVALNLDKEISDEVEVKIKYSGYLKRQEQQVNIADKLEKIRIPKNIDYTKISHISTETKEKLAKIRPINLAQASRIGGVKPADISVLMVMIESNKIPKTEF